MLLALYPEVTCTPVQGQSVKGQQTTLVQNIRITLSSGELAESVLRQNCGRLNPGSQELEGRVT